MLGVNSNLPPDVNATWANVVDDDFHARFSAESRTYCYLILNRLARSSLYRHRAWWVHETLDAALMQAGGELLLGEHPFARRVHLPRERANQRDRQDIERCCDEGERGRGCR